MSCAARVRLPRARRDARLDSDWDLGYLGSAAFDPEALRALAIGILGTERVDFAVRVWCDTEPVLQRGYADVLAELTP